MNLLKEEINLSKFENIELISKAEVKKALDYVIKKIDENLEIYTNKFPSACTTNMVYRVKENDDWTNGFWTAMIWLAYEYTGNEKYKNVANIHIDSFEERLEKNFILDHHDLGFLYTLSAVAGYKLTGDNKAKKIAICAADKLLDRYQKVGEFIQAWGKIGDAKEYRLIIDCFFNLPLLYWASEVTGNNKYKDIANKHFSTAVRTVIRDDSSTFHTYYFDMKTGEAIKGVTHQGYSDDSSWARGQAWAIYGLPLNYKYNNFEQCEYIYERVLNYYLNRIPDDLVCYWDLIFKDEDNQPRDSSSAAIVICGIFEMNKYIKNKEVKKIYEKAAHGMLRSLINNYTTKGIKSNGILAHGVYSWHHKKGIDECNLWGDYFYMESLMRLYKNWNLYW